MDNKEGHKFALDVSWVLTGSILIFFFDFMLKPIMVYYIGAENFGIWATASAYLFIIQMIGNIDVNVATVKYVSELKNDIEKLYEIISSSLIVSVLLGVFVFCTIYLSSDLLATIFRMDLLKTILLISSLTLPFTFMRNTVLAILQGLRKMKYASIFSSIVQITLAGSMILPLVFGYGLIDAVIGYSFANVFLSTLSLFLIRDYIGNFKVKNCFKNGKKLIYFGMHTVFANGINVINYKADILMVGYFLTAKDVAYYSVAVGLSRIIWNIPNSVGSVTFPFISELWSQNKLAEVRELVDDCIRHNGYILIFCGMCLIFYSNLIIEILYNEEFYKSIIPFRILIVSTVIFGTTKSIGSFFASTENLKLYCKIPLYLMIVNITLNYIMIPLYGLTGAAVATMVSFLVGAISFMYYLNKIIDYSPDLIWITKIFTLSTLSVVLFFEIIDLLSIQNSMYGYIISFFILVMHLILTKNFILNTKDKNKIAKLSQLLLLKSKKFMNINFQERGN